MSVVVDKSTNGVELSIHMEAKQGMSKMDRCIQKSRQAIMDVFMKLMSEQDFEKINARLNIWSSMLLSIP